jgi:YegS/Rv2252/BmrU family lipid kinase
MNRRALLLINPHARRGEETQSLATEYLQASGFDLVNESWDEPSCLSDLICSYRDRVDCVIFGGGDGTVNAAIAGLLETQLPLGVLPLGTANNLARTLGIPTSLQEACKTLAQSTIKSIDLGWVNGHYFLNVAGMGISADINQQVEKNLKRQWGVIAYALTALRVMSQYRRFQAEIRCNGQSISVKTFQITICNGRHYGSGLTVATDAAIDDQRLDLCSMEIRHWWEAIALLPGMIRGEYATGQRMRTLSGQAMEIHTRQPLPIDTDGELTTQTPAHFKVIPNAIWVLAPTPASHL